MQDLVSQHKMTIAFTVALAFLMLVLMHINSSHTEVQAQFLDDPCPAGTSCADGLGVTKKAGTYQYEEVDGRRILKCNALCHCTNFVWRETGQWGDASNPAWTACINNTQHPTYRCYANMNKAGQCEVPGDVLTRCNPGTTYEKVKDSVYVWKRIAPTRSRSCVSVAPTWNIDDWGSLHCLYQWNKNSNQNCDL